MIRVVAFLVLAGLAAAGAVWLADRPGEIAITWMGYRIDTSMMVALGALVLIVVAAMILWSALRLLLRSPRIAATAMRERRERKGYEAISRGLIAIGAGDTRAALRYAGDAERKAPDEPLALLLRAQTAQLSGDRAAADAAFRAMAERDDMQLLGLRGLFIEAQRRADFGAALDLPSRRRRCRRWPRGPTRRCWSSAAPPRTGPARSRYWRTTARAVFSIATYIAVSAPCCSPRAPWRPRRTTAMLRAASRWKP